MRVNMVLLSLGLVYVPAMGFAGDWPQFRGTGNAGVAIESNLPAQWGPEKNVQWKVKIPGVAWSSPIVWGDKVFVTTAITENQRKPAAGGGFGGGGGAGRPGGGGFGAPAQPGQILLPFLQDRLNLTADQKKQLESLQKDIDGKIEKNLNDDQRKQFKEPRQGPGGGGRPGGGFGGFPQPGQILPQSLRDSLRLTDQQKQQFDNLQKEVDAGLAKLLNEEQNKQLKEMREAMGRGPGGGGGRPGGFGNPRPPDVVYRWEVHCLDRATGKILWKQLALEAKPRIATHGSNTYASETPVTDGERVYAYFAMHGLFCYDIAGNLIWKKDLGAYQMQMGWGTASSPVLEADRLFVQCDNEEKSFLVALDKKNGNELWRVPRTERTSWSTPAIWKNKERTELVTMGPPKVRSYDPATGKLLWELTIGNGQCSSSPTCDGEMLYVGVGRMGGGGGGFGGGRPGGGAPGGGAGGGGEGGGGLYAIRAGATGDVTPKQGETSSAGVAWSHSRGGPEMASPLVYQGHLYILGRNGGIVTCYDAKTGKQVYRERLPAAKSFWASPWAGNGKIFCLDDGGTTHVLQAGPEFKVLGKNTIDEMFWASPAVAGGAVFLRSVDHLYCIKQ